MIRRIPQSPLIVALFLTTSPTFSALSAFPALSEGEKSVYYALGLGQGEFQLVIDQFDIELASGELQLGPGLCEPLFYRLLRVRPSSGLPVPPSFSLPLWALDVAETENSNSG